MSPAPVNRRAIIAGTCALVASCLLCSVVLADSHKHNDNDRQQGSAEHARISLDEAVQRAEQRYHARVVKAESRNSDGRVIYMLRLVSDDGRVFSVRVDAQTGSMD
ncbi:MAG TPA: PepSY domain-containing protein [Steroidobacteraceae bacterium]|nr:PepSY domain-containing protein [Steroidobacteraceae bacterium]